jgi:hypothetical protein
VVAPPPAAPAAPAIEDPFAGKTFEVVEVLGDTSTSLIGMRREFRTDGTLVVSYFMIPNARREEPLQISDPVPYTMLEGQQFIVAPSSEHPRTVSYTPVPPDGFQMVWGSSLRDEPSTFVMRPFQPLEITPANLANTKWSIEPGGSVSLSFDEAGFPVPFFPGEHDFFWKRASGKALSVYQRLDEGFVDEKWYLSLYSLSLHLVVVSHTEGMGIEAYHRVE